MARSRLQARCHGDQGQDPQRHGVCTFGFGMTRSRHRDRPLWQFFLALFLVFFAIQRGQLGAIVYLSKASSALVVAYGLQTVLALVTALGIGLGRRGVITLVIVLGISVAATSLFEAFYLAVRPLLPVTSEVLVVAILTAALSLLLRRELGVGARTAGKSASPGLPPS